MAFVSGLGVGAGLLYWMDPQSGRRRRARSAEKLTHGAHALADGSEKGARDLAHRASGALAHARSWFRRGAVPDEVLEERVRAKLGRVCSHPGAIRVRSMGDRVELTGQILRQDRYRVLRAVHRVRGVEGVEDRLEVHDKPDDIPALQGPPHRVQGNLWQREVWTPAARLVCGVAGGASFTYGLTREGASGWPWRVLGVGLLARSLSNRSLRDLLAAPGERFAARAFQLAADQTDRAVGQAVTGQQQP
jgi:hypothetical protein